MIDTLAQGAFVALLFAPLFAYYIGKDEGLSGQTPRTRFWLSFSRTFPFRWFYKRGRDIGTALRRAREAERLRHGVLA